MMEGETGARESESLTDSVNCDAVMPPPFWVLLPSLQLLQEGSNGHLGGNATLLLGSHLTPVRPKFRAVRCAEGDVQRFNADRSGIQTERLSTEVKRRQQVWQAVTHSFHSRAPADWIFQIAHFLGDKIHSPEHRPLEPNGNMPVAQRAIGTGTGSTF